jgi:hypothetical protein
LPDRRHTTASFYGSFMIATHGCAAGAPQNRSAGRRAPVAATVGRFAAALKARDFCFREAGFLLLRG